jgi:hypothetical protein
MGRVLILCDRPGLVYSLVGLTTSLINIYAAQGGHWYVTAKVTIIVAGVQVVATSMQTLVSWVRLRNNKAQNEGLVPGTLHYYEALHQVCKTGKSNTQPNQIMLERQPQVV